MHGRPQQPNQRLRNWVFTLNNPDADRPAEWGQSIFDRGNVRYLIYQLERGSNGTPHFQGYIEFTAALRMSSVRSILPRAHLERRRGTAQQASDYCRKIDSRVDGPWEFGTLSISSQGTRTDLTAVAETIKSGSTVREIYDSHPSAFIKFHRGIREAIIIRDTGRAARMADKKIILIYGSSHIGKTTWVRFNFGDRLYIKSGAHKWFDGYIDQEVVLIDDFAGGKSGFMCSTMLNILDRWDCQVEIKGGMATLHHNVMFVTTNIHPREWYDFGDRQMHYIALSNRFTQVWTMIDYKPVVLNKDHFFNSHYGYDNYRKEPFGVLCIKKKDEEDDALSLASQPEEAQEEEEESYSEPSLPDFSGLYGS